MTHLWNGVRLIVLPVICFVLVCGCSSGPQVRHEAVFYPALPEKPRLQFLTAISSEDDLTNKKPGLDDFLLGGKETDKTMGRPYAVHAAKGMIYLTDRVSNDILEINLLTNTINPLRAGGRGALQVPSGLWVAEDGSKYIADIKRKQVVVFDRGNRFQMALGDSTSLERPVDVAVHGDRVYVCDMQKHQVVVFDRVTGAQLAIIGKPGENEGELNRPSHLTVDRQGNLYVNDAFNFRIQKFSPQGKFLQRFGTAGNTLGSLARPKGVAIDSGNNLYVVDAAFENVQIFNPEGKLLLFFGGAGDKPGSMYLPAGIAIDDQNLAYFQKYADPRFKLNYLIYVCNMTGDNKLNVYGFGDWAEGPR
jgi:DNA-binding beta-propeller fold protein YncE